MLCIHLIGCWYSPLSLHSLLRQIRVSWWWWRTVWKPYRRRPQCLRNGRNGYERGICYYTNIYLGKFKKTGLAINRNVAFSYIWFLWLPVSGGWHWCGTVCRNSYPWTSHRLCIAVPGRWCGDPHEESREQGPEILPHLSSSALHYVVGSGGGYGGSGVCIILRSQTESGIKRAGTAAGSQHLVNCWNRVRSRYKQYLVFPVVSLIMIFL